MVITAEDQFGGGPGTGFNFNGLYEFVSEGLEGEIDPDDVEAIKKRFDELKKYLPYLALIGIVFAVKHFKKNGLAKSVDLVALSNVIQAFTPLIFAAGWVLFTKVNDTAKNLSFAFATAETIPTIDLNLPPGINLGSYFVVGDQLLDMVPDAQKWLSEAKEAAPGFVEAALLGPVFTLIKGLFGDNDKK